MPRNAPQGKQGRQVHAGEAEESGQGSEAVVGEGAAGMPSEEDGDMAALRYAGIGARATPAAVLADMTVMAGWLVRTGWHLESGGVAGADSAFAAGAPTEQRTLTNGEPFGIYLHAQSYRMLSVASRNIA